MGGRDSDLSTLKTDLRAPPPLQLRPQARSYDEAASSSAVGWYFSNAHAKSLSHPLPVMRAREVERFYNSDEYRRLLAPER